MRLRAHADQVRSLRGRDGHPDLVPFFIFGQYRTGSTTGYSAVFTDVSRLKPGQSVRVAGVRVGTVDSVSLQPDKKSW